MVLHAGAGCCRASEEACWHVRGVRGLLYTKRQSVVAAHLHYALSLHLHHICVVAAKMH
jgi:hypothetical protein